MTFKLATADTAYSSAEFTFPNDPIALQQDMSSQVEMLQRTHKNLHGAKADIGAVLPKTITLNGTFYGSSKLSNFRNFSRYFYEPGLKRLYFDSTNFVYCYGKRLAPSDLGNKANFKDYRANFIAPLPFVHEDTRQSYTQNSTDATATNFSDSTFNNSSGTAPAYIWDWTITNNSGSAITQVEIGDAAVSGGNVQYDRFKITWTGTLSPGQTLQISTLYTKRGVLKKMYPHDGSGTEKGAFDPKRASGIYQIGHRIETGATPTFSFKLTGNDASTDVRARWHIAHWM